MSLTKEEKEAVEQTWKEAVSKNLRTVSVTIFIQFLTKYPEYQKKFRAFTNLPLEELPQNKRFQAHTFTAVSALDGILSNLDDAEIVSELLITVGQNHKRHKIDMKGFQRFTETLMDLLPGSVGNLWTLEAQTGWGKVIELLMQKIREGVEGNNEYSD